MPGLAPVICTHPEPLRLNPLRCLYGLYPFLSVQSKGFTY
ncbi:hypothetical protein QIT81_gp45 [Pseudomonas phage MR15]|uniref:Uncharacterized protein n=1 Tax=Pseudomonas phage MR15 TaxID=2711179 RepID=A0A6M3TDY6_9CAUD|nr:hypothetical protein QIT81_gp45 [Pseudomonas phage MR15]QJD55106.1 hypothetical protein Psm1vBMR13_gp44c [Pseudomonas phage MR13]QJD55259.1 hypothetical protein Psm1vBMR15_gp45c [Pseudomonas phage MR15]